MSELVAATDGSSRLAAIARVGRSTRVDVGPVLPLLVQRATVQEFEASGVREVFISAQLKVAPSEITGDLSVRALLSGGLYVYDDNPYGAAALLAWQAGPYAHPDAETLTDGWNIARGMRQLPPHLRLADNIGRRFTGTVSELAALVAAVLTDPVS